MTDFWASGWYKLAGRGVRALVLGVLALVWPISTLEVLVVLFALYALVDGGLMVYTALTSPRLYPVRGRLILGGIVGMAVGVIAVIWRRTTGALLFYLVAARFVIVGVLDVANAALLRRMIRREWMLALSGAITIGVGLLLLFQPGWGLIAVVWTIALYAIVYGLLHIALAWRLQHRARSPSCPEHPSVRV